MYASQNEVDTNPMEPAGIDPSQERFLRDTLLDSLNDPAWIKDVSSRFIYVNKALADLVNRTAEEMLGTTDFDYFPQEIARSYIAADAEVRKTGVEARVLEQIVTADGETKWIETTKKPVRDGSGRIIGTTGVARDVTRREKAEIDRQQLTEAQERLHQSEQLFRAIANRAPVMLWMTDARGECNFINQRMLEFAGLTADDLIKSWAEAVHPEDVANLRASIRTALREQKWLRTEVRFRRHDGEYRQLLVEAASRYDEEGTFAGYVASCIDLTDLRRLERRLEDEKRLSGLGRLATTIAHEMNNVLMAVQPFADVIRRTTSPTVLERAAQQISNSVERGRRITHSILRLANTSAPNLEPFDLREWVWSHTVELITILGDKIELIVDAPKEARILADPVQLQQVITNLATNARDAIDGNGTLTISIRPNSADTSADVGEGEFIHLAVSDTGSGIAEALLDQVFEPMFTTKSSGTGLGLPIVRDIITKHHGFMIVESELGRGTTFHIFLPATDCQPAPRVESESDFPSAVRKILIVEDDELVASGISALLEIEGIDTEVVATGRGALPGITRFSPDLVILDIGLPDASGSEVFAEIRSVYRELPILFSTGHEAKVGLEEDLRDGPTGYLLKPYDFSSLVSAVRKIIASREQGTVH